MKKKLGIGSLSLLLAALAILWSANLPGGFCLGDYVLGLFGIPGWSSGSSRVHYTVFIGLLLYIPAFILGRKHDQHLFARSGKWISGCIGGFLLVMGCAILIWGQL